MKRLKNNRFVRGLYFALRRSFCHGKRAFGHLSDNVIFTPPLWLGNPKNIFIYDDVGVGANAFISAINAKFVCKGHCAIAEHFTVHTGNHVHVPGKFITDITEANKPAGYDRDVTVEEDVWIGCNVTLLSGGDHRSWMYGSGRCGGCQKYASLHHSGRSSGKADKDEMEHRRDIGT